jgi:hypothetical protein
MLDRRLVILGALALPAGTRAAQADTPAATVWRDPNCGCCEAWVAHLRAEGFAVEEHVVADLAPIRRILATPADLQGCHVARVAGFAIEGHVPARAIRRLLAERPAGVRGLAVPGMPVGSPGMEVPGRAPDTYDVVAFGTGSRSRFMRFVGPDAVSG